MTMHQDIRGLDLTANSAQSARAFDHAIDGFAGYRADLPKRMEALFALDPENGMAHCLRGYLTMMGFNQAMVPVARAASDTATFRLAGGTTRERAMPLPSQPGSMAGPIERLGSGMRSWTRIRTTCWPSAWRIS